MAGEAGLKEKMEGVKKKKREKRAGVWGGLDGTV